MIRSTEQHCAAHLLTIGDDLRMTKAGTAAPGELPVPGELR